MPEPVADGPHWPTESVFPARGLQPAELAIEPIGRWFTSDDGARLAVLDWLPPADVPLRGHVIVLHGVQSHAGWYHGLGRRLAAAGYRALFPDRRGSGANTSERGHAPSARRLIDDVGCLARQLQEEWPHSRVALAGISWGGKLVVATASRYSQEIAAIALICPGLTPRMGVSRRERLAIATAMLTGRSRSKTFPIPLANPSLFTDDLEAQIFIATDPLSLRLGTAGLMASSFFLDQRVRHVTVRRFLAQPALLMLAEHDRIVDNRRTRELFERLLPPSKHLIAYDGAHHTLEFEADPSRYARDLIGWLGTTLRNA